ncbi:MAG: hypothetical protein K6E31_07870, partial [bacterium]|nr:hypothetical protein [bacterium]
MIGFLEGRGGLLGGFLGLPGLVRQAGVFLEFIDRHLAGQALALRGIVHAGDGGSQGLLGGGHALGQGLALQQGLGVFPREGQMLLLECGLERPDRGLGGAGERGVHHQDGRGHLLLHHLRGLGHACVDLPHDLPQVLVFNLRDAEQNGGRVGGLVRFHQGGAHLAHHVLDSLAHLRGQGVQQAGPFGLGQVVKARQALFKRRVRRHIEFVPQCRVGHAGLGGLNGGAQIVG